MTDVKNPVPPKTATAVSKPASTGVTKVPDAPSAAGPTKLSDDEEATATAVLGENVVEDKSAEGVRADLSSTLAHPGAKPAQEVPPGSTVQREDGTFTVKGKEEYTVHYVHGNRVLVKQEQIDKINALTEELNTLADDRGVSEIPVTDVYWEKKKELDAYVATLRR